VKRFIVVFLVLLSSCSWFKKEIPPVSVQQEQEFLVYVEGQHRIYFKHNSSVIEDEGVDRINALISQLSIVRNVTVMIYGYTDKTEGKSKKLSEDRVDSVKKALKDSGIIAKNSITIKTSAFGKYDTMASFGMPNNNPASRRVDIFIVANRSS